MSLDARDATPLGISPEVDRLVREWAGQQGYMDDQADHEDLARRIEALLNHDALRGALVDAVEALRDAHAEPRVGHSPEDCRCTIASALAHAEAVLKGAAVRP